MNEKSRIFYESVDKLFNLLKGTKETMDHRALDAIARLFPGKPGCFDTRYIGVLISHCKNTFQHEDDKQYHSRSNGKSPNMNTKRLKYLFRYVNVIKMKVFNEIYHVLETKFPTTQTGGYTAKGGEIEFLTYPLLQHITSKISHITSKDVIETIDFTVGLFISILGILIIIYGIISVALAIAGVLVLLGISVVHDIIVLILNSPTFFKMVGRRVIKSTRRVAERVRNYFENKRRERENVKYANMHPAYAEVHLDEPPEAEARPIQLDNDYETRLSRSFVKYAENDYRRAKPKDINDFLRNANGVKLYDKIFDKKQKHSVPITQVAEGKDYGAMSVVPLEYHFTQILPPNIPVYDIGVSYGTTNISDTINELLNITLAQHGEVLEKSTDQDISNFLQKKLSLYITKEKKIYELPYEITQPLYVETNTNKYINAKNNDIWDFLNGHGKPLFTKHDDGTYTPIPNIKISQKFTRKIGRTLSPIREGEIPPIREGETTPIREETHPPKSWWNRFTIRSRKVQQLPSGEVPVKTGIVSRVRNSFKRKPKPNVVIPMSGVRGGRKKRRTKSLSSRVSLRSPR
jgi:hypothetical protein